MEKQPHPLKKQFRFKWLVAAVVVAIVIGSAAGVWFGGMRYHYFPKRWGVVVPGGIYRGARLHPALMEATLRKHGVKSIVNLCAGGPDESDNDKLEALAAAKLGVTVHYLPMGGDGTCQDNELARYPEAVACLAEAAKTGHPVFVHCAAGTNRTGGVVAVYRTLVEGKSGGDAYEEMLRYNFRPWRTVTLLPFLKKNMRYFAEELKKKGVIPSVPDPLPVIEPN